MTGTTPTIKPPHKTINFTVTFIYTLQVFSWMMSNRLQLNPAKTEVLWCSSARRQHQIPTGPVRVGDTSVLPVRTVRDLGSTLMQMSP